MFVGFFHSVWENVFYIPLFNALIWLYNGFAGQNLGVAIILLTIAIRFVLLPFSILSERNKHIYAKVEDEVREIEKDFKNDAEQQKEQIRALLRKHNVSPWSKFWLLLIQVMVLVVLYQVFAGAFKTNRFDQLYPSVQHPDIVFPNFLGFDLSQKSFLLALIVGVWLFADLAVEARKHKVSSTRSEVFYRIAFPTFTVVALYLLPSAKSLFILTSMSFSFILSSIRKGIFKE